MKNPLSEKTLTSRSTLNLTANGGRIVLSFLATLLASRWLGADQFGQFSLIFGYTSFLNYLITLGFDHTFPYFLPRQTGANGGPLGQGLLKVALLLSACLGATAITVTVVVFHLPMLQQHQHLYFTALVFVSQTAIWAQGTVFAGYLRGLKEFLPLIIKEQIAFPILHVMALVVLVGFLGQGLSGYAIGYLIATLLASLIPFVTHWKLFRSSMTEGFVTPEESWKWVKFSLPLAMMNVLEPLMSSINLILMGFFFHSSDVGIFSLCVRLAITAQLAVAAVGPIVAPYLSEESHNSSQPGRLFQNISNWTVRWTIVFSFALLTTPELIVHIFGDGYAGALSIIGLVLIGPAFEGAFGITKTALAMAGHNRINAILLGFGLLMQILAALVLMPSMSLTGAALAFSVGFIFVNLTRMVYYRKKAGVWPLTSRHAVENLVLFLVFSGVSVALRYYETSLLTRLSTVVILPALFLIFHLKTAQSKSLSSRDG